MIGNARLLLQNTLSCPNDFTGNCVISPKYFIWPIVVKAVLGDMTQNFGVGTELEKMKTKFF
jgi:hypothetical protein